MSKYKAIKVNGKKIDEHRYIMEQQLGRKLDYNEIVHHKDEDTSNNDPSNLELTNRSEHTKHHRKGKSASESTKKALSKAKKGKAHHWQRKLTKEDVEYIRANYKPRSKEYGTRALARKYGIDHMTIVRILDKSMYTSW